MEADGTLSAESRTFAFDWNPSDHAAVTRLLVREQFGSGVGRIAKWLVVGIAAFAALVVAASAALGDWYSALRLTPWTLAVGLLLLGFGQITGRLRAWQVRRSDPNVAHPFTYRFADTGLRVQLHTVEAELKWEGMYRVRETADMLLFYYSRRAAYFLPKRAVGAESLDVLRDWIRGRLPVGVPYVRDG